MMKRKIETEKTVLTLWVIGKHQELTAIINDLRVSAGP